MDTEAVYGKVFIYDGLYDVLEHKTVIGISGFKVIKFRLRRRTGQPPLASTTVEFGHGSIPKAFTAMRRPGLVDEDISGGLERLPVVAVNDVDKELPPCTRPQKVLVRDAPSATQGKDPRRCLALPPSPHVGSSEEAVAAVVAARLSSFADRFVY